MIRRHHFILHPKIKTVTIKQIMNIITKFSISENTSTMSNFKNLCLIITTFWQNLIIIKLKLKETMKPYYWIN